jgi:hypothetical protein
MPSPDESRQAFPAVSDERVVNNIMRHNYRKLSGAEQGQMALLKDAGLNFIRLLHTIGNTDSSQDSQGSRELLTAQTKMEEAVMWAVKHVTR